MKRLMVPFHGYSLSPTPQPGNFSSPVEEVKPGLSREVIFFFFLFSSFDFIFISIFKNFRSKRLRNYPVEKAYGGVH